MAITQQVPRRRAKVEKIPEYLVREILNGKVLPYIGYREVLSKEKQLSEIMGCSSLQGIIVGLIYGFFFTKINRKKYFIATNEAGLHLDKKSNLSNDVAIYEKEGLVLNNNYFKVAPKIAIEVDIRVDLDPDDHTDKFSYVLEKAQKMIDFGTQKVIWVMTDSKSIIVFSKTETSIIVNFDTDILVLDDCVLNLGQLLKDEDIAY
jgi:Uma2 family endonuclease